MTDKRSNPTISPRRRGWTAAGIATVAVVCLALAACTSGSAINAPTASSPAPSAAAAPIPSSSAAAPGSPVSGAPCISASDPTQLCAGGPVGPLPSSEAPTSGAVASPVPPPVPASPVPAGPASQAPGRPATSSGTVVVTAAQDGSTLHLSVGERFTLELGTAATWQVKVADPSIVAPVSGVALAPGEQGVFVAKAPGTTTLAAVGGPSCSPGEPCPQFRIVFTLTITVS